MRAQKTAVTWKSFGLTYARIFKSRSAAEKFARARPPTFWRTAAILTPMPTGLSGNNPSQVIIDDPQEPSGEREVAE